MKILFVFFGVVEIGKCLGEINEFLIPLKRRLGMIIMIRKARKLEKRFEKT